MPDLSATSEVTAVPAAPSDEAFGYGAATAETLFVVYCAGPHCNGADKAAMRLAALGRPVKKMIGGIEGWRDEGFALRTGDRP